ncbi:MAG: nucleotidyltransferase domain-containing protein [Promethearchaeia archaeon]
MITYPKRDHLSRECALRLKNTLTVDTIYLFGSTARRDDKVFSDIDICLVGPLEKLNREERVRINDITAEFYIDHFITINWIYFNNQEWNKEKLPLIKTIKTEGKVLWEKEIIK